MRTRILLVAATAALALALPGCSTTDEPDGSPESAPTRTVPARAASHLVVDVSDADVSTRERIPTDDESIITGPSGTLVVEAIETAPSVPGVLVGTGSAGKVAVPAEGEAFLVVTVTVSDTDEDGDGLAVVFEMDGQSAPAPVLRDGETTALLVSVPAYGEAFLTVEEQGRVQRINLADGARDEKTRDGSRSGESAKVLTPRR